MLINHTLDKLRNPLRMNALAAAIAHQCGNPAFEGLSFEERLGLGVDAEVLDREQRRIGRLDKQARFKTSACLEDVDYAARRGLDRNVVTALSGCGWVAKSTHVILVGPTGVGKTWLACALGKQAVRQGFSVLYKRVPRLMEELEVAHKDGSLPNVRAMLARKRVLILDDWGVAPLTARGRQDLHEIVDDRVGTGSVVITSQLPVDKWHAFIGDATVADAILDRLVHTAQRIELKGESLRKPKKSA